MSHANDLAALERLPSLGEALERLHQLAQADGEFAGLAGRVDAESVNRRGRLDKLASELRTEIAMDISATRSALRASIESDYPPGNRRAEELTLLEHLLGPGALNKLDELNERAEKIGREISRGQHDIALEREVVDNFAEGLRLLAREVSDVPAQDTETSTLIHDDQRRTSR